jgi:hypothetical protein
VLLGFCFSVLLRLPPSLLLCFFSARPRPPLFRPCAMPHRSRAAWRRATRPPLPRCRLPDPALASPRRATPSGCLPKLPSLLLTVAAIQRHLLLPGDPTCCSSASRRRSSPRCLLLYATRHLRLCPNLARGRHARRQWSALASARPRLNLDPEHLLELLAHSLFHLNTHISLVLACSDHHLSPDRRRHHYPPSAAAFAASEPQSRIAKAPQ